MTHPREFMNSKNDNEKSAADWFINISSCTQRELFGRAFDHIQEKTGVVNLNTSLVCLYDANIANDDKMSVGWACLALLNERKDEFEQIEVGLVKKMQGSIVRAML